MSNGVKENPYLAHLSSKERKTGGSSSNPSTKEPFYGFLPRKVTGEQARKVLVRTSVFRLCRQLFNYLELRTEM